MNAASGKTRSLGWVQECPRRLMVGFHVPDYDQVPEYRDCERDYGAPGILSAFDAKHFARELRKAYVQAFWFYSKCHRGNAYYPSKVGHVHSAMGGRDFFGELCEACLSEDIVPLCVYEFSDLRMPKDHPDWCHRIPSGNASDTDTTDAIEGSRIGGPCLNGPYGEFVLEQTREVLKEYPVKGYYIDFLGLFGMENWICPCCGDAYRKSFGQDFTGTANMSHDEFVRYIRWWYGQNDQYAKRVRRLVEDLRSDVLFTHNFHGYADCPNMQRMDFASANCDFVTGDLFHLRAGMLQMSWKIRGYATLSRRLPADVLLDGMTCVNGDFSTAKALATYKAELWTARSLNVGTTASVVMDIDGGFNQHIIELVKQIYAAQEPYEPWLRNMQALAHVGIVRSHDSLEFRPGAETDLAGRIAPHAQDFAGWCQVLVATHQLWDLVPSHLLTPEHLRRFDVLILPSVSCMSHAECAAVRAWLTAGGTLIASGETSLYDPDGNLQDDFQLADVFGALFVEDVSPERSYAKIEDAALEPEHAWVDGTLPMDGGQLAVTASDSAEVLGTIHGNPGIRMVNVLVRRREPALLRHRVGAGTCTYFAGAVGRQYRRCGQANILTVLSRLLDQAMGAKAAVALDAPTSVELFAHTQKGQPHMVVNLVNIFAGLSRSDGRVILGPTPGVMSVVRHDEYQESPRLSQVVVRFREDPGRSIQRVYLAPSQGTELPLEREGNEVLVTVRDLGEHAMLVAEYEN